MKLPVVSKRNVYRPQAMPEVKMTVTLKQEPTSIGPTARVDHKIEQFIGVVTAINPTGAWTPDGCTNAVVDMTGREKTNANKQHKAHVLLGWEALVGDQFAATRKIPNDGMPFYTLLRRA